MNRLIHANGSRPSRAIVHSPRRTFVHWVRRVAAVVGFLGAFSGLSGRLLAVELVEKPEVKTPSGTNAIVSWATDVPTGGRVRYGVNPAQLDREVKDEVRPRHSVELTGLRPGTRYTYVIGTARLPLATNAFVTPGGSPPVPVVAGPANGATSPPSVRPPGTSGIAGAPVAPRAPPTRETWGQMASLQDHFDRHGRDFQSKNPDDYARQAWEFLQRARTDGLPTKVDVDGVIRVFDPKTRAFAAYNRNGRTKTYFKPNSRDYFERQPGRLVDARSLRF